MRYTIIIETNTDKFSPFAELVGDEYEYGEILPFIHDLESHLDNSKKISITINGKVMKP